VYLGDALEIAAKCPKNAVDLVYADPHFSQTENKRVGQKADTELTFEDRWQGGLHAYLAWLEGRVRGMRVVLKPQGCFCCTWTGMWCITLKLLCDKIFGAERFQNELIWYYQTGGASKGRFSRKHDTILLYSMGEFFYFDGKSVAIRGRPRR